MADSAALLQSDFLLWKNPKKTGAALAAFNLVVILVVYLEVSLTPFFCSVAMLAIVAGGAIKFLTPEVSERNLDVVSKDAVTLVVDSTRKALETAILTVRDVVLWKETGTPMKALVALEVVRRLAPWVSVRLLVFLAGNLAFVLPYVVEVKKDTIHKSIEPHLKKLLAKKDEILAKVPKYTDVFKDE